MQDTLGIGQIAAAPGTSARGYLDVGMLGDGMTVQRVPVWILNGAEEGPVGYLHSGAHGQETAYSFQALRRLFESLDPRTLRGALVAVPIANPLAHQSGARVAPERAAREGIAFAGDLHKVFPGDANGSMTQRIAAVLWNTIIPHADFAIDYHAVGLPGMPFAFMYRGGATDAAGTAVWEQSLALARAFGFTIIETRPNGLTLAGACMDVQCPAMMIEMPAARHVDAAVIDATLRGTRNVLRSRGMLDGAPEAQGGYPVVPGVRRALPSIRAQRGGFISFEAPCGERLARGTVIAVVHDALGALAETITMPEDGYVMTYPPVSWAGVPAVGAGDYVADLFA